MTGTRLRYPGRPASQGTALGDLYRVDRPLTGPGPVPPARTAAPHGGLRTLTLPGARTDPDPGPTGDPGPDPEAENGAAGPAARIAAAFDGVADRLDAVGATLRAQGRTEEAEIMEVAGLIARDPDLRQQARQLAAGGAPAPDAVRRAVDDQAAAIAALGDPVLAERAADVRQVGRRVLAVLLGGGEPEPGRPVVLAAHEIGAADLLEPGRTVTAALSVTGGPNSHAAIVARSLGIPLLLGVDPGLLDLPDGVETLVDGAVTVVRPAPAERAAALTAIAAARARRERLAAERHLPARTADGHRVTLRANVATPGEVRSALQAGADGVGLLRTELPFLDAPQWPTRAQHAAALRPVLAALAGQHVTVRTLDFADDKLPPFLAGDRPPGARLGRGLPLMLARPDAFAEQFAALLAAGAGDGLRIMIPMVADVGEVRACRALLEQAAAELGVPAPPLGIMIELPEAVGRIGALAREAAFLSLGTNDLTSRVLGLDRRDPAAGPARTAHPAVLRAVAGVVAAARSHHLPLSVCGDAAAHPLVLPLLLGLGCDTLSVAPAALDEVRAAVRRLDHAACRAVAADALVLETEEEVHHLVGRRLPAPPS
ncbi:phosphocarrier protein FPr [Actinacidiphila yanglinensis]|uniref:Phosphocarrier protein FPr n=1 Tax=Actinacidiphila yanglinensis TaxID=310779 RepID=A0A1H6CV01_9ACTN|nr:putative PEP-binding protein [Actinacidiphila yanglinensis]SEG76802.1 phosphocarrier protein FPr [Actinacidiphila yanglinensis]